MNRRFKPAQFQPVADGTLLAPIINPVDSRSQPEPCGSADPTSSASSLAAGIIAAGSCSKIHLHPVVTQLTYVLEGVLRIRMKTYRMSAQAPVYDLTLAVGETAVTEPCTYLQLINDTSDDCRVLYIVSPAYVSVSIEGEIFYDDAIVVDENWAGLAERDQSSKELFDPDTITLIRAEAVRRLLKARS